MQRNDVHECDVFISYRRDGGDMAALLIYQALKAKGYNVFYDLEGLGAVKFDEALLDYIRSCTYFVFILSPHSLDRCDNEDDWVRREIITAMACGKRIVPVRLNGASFPPTLPKAIDAIRHQNGPAFYTEYFNEGIDRLCRNFLKIKPTSITPTPETLDSVTPTPDPLDSVTPTPVPLNSVTPTPVPIDTGASVPASQNVSGHIQRNRPEASPVTGEIQDSWDEIIAVIDKGEAQWRYAIGAYKPLNLGRFGIINMQLAGFDLDERADGRGKAATTWIAKEILPETHRWNPKWDNDKVGTGTIGGWEKCELRQWMNEMVLSAIPENVKDRLISVKKSQKSYDTNWNRIQQTTEDSVWIPSYDEVFGEQSLYYGLFRNRDDRRVKMRDGSTVWWWLRSAGGNIYASGVYFFGSFNYYHVNNSGGVVVCFCL